MRVFHGSYMVIESIIQAFFWNYPTKPPNFIKNIGKKSTNS